MTIPGSSFSTSSSALWLDAAEPAKNTALTPARLSTPSTSTSDGSSPTRVSVPACSSSAAIRRSSIPEADVATISRISRPSRESLPTRAKVVECSANSLLRRRGGCGANLAPQNASQSNHDAASHITDREREQYRLRPDPHRVNERAGQNDNQRSVRFAETDSLEAVITPGAHHQEPQQQEQHQPQRGHPPRGQRLSIRGKHHGAHHPCSRWNRQPDKVF